MAKSHGRSALVLFDEFNLSAWLTNYDGASDVDVPETSSFGNTARRYEVVGLRGGTMGFSGHYDAAAGASYDTFSDTFAHALGRVITVFPAGGAAIGDPAELMSGRETSLQTGTPVDGVAAVSAQAVGDGGVDYGKVLSPLTAKTATGDSASLDNAAATTNGGVGHLNATAVSASDTLDSKVQHSTDDSVWVDLITFAQIAAPGKQRTEVTGTVNRYLRETHTLAGAGISITYAVAFARR